MARVHAFDPPGTQLDARTLVVGEVEDVCRSRGWWPAIGTDEVGRGPLAGPVTAAAVVLREGAVLPGLNDSKQLTHAQREALVPLIQAQSVAWAIVSATEAQVDQLNILQASLWAMRQAVEQVCDAIQAQGLDPPRILLVDGRMAVPGFARVPQCTVIRGDGRSLAIAAASILAKVDRDAHMALQDERFPGYGFAGHKGYATPQHRAALQALGPCRIHRRSFAPVAALLGLLPPMQQDLDLRADLADDVVLAP